eukprot:TRINITY_DN1685_c0_g1_i1.p1 TRINITY_DN1685_c0_g1~~TRINITY_DN1685_c0_g1_i1.p1  ORF type:complete len:286 (-),score=85.19 TRINITY_DN1685_c0_g1_i1:149-1006(-)
MDNILLQAVKDEDINALIPFLQENNDNANHVIFQALDLKKFSIVKLLLEEYNVDLLFEYTFEGFKYPLYQIAISSRNIDIVELVYLNLKEKGVETMLEKNYLIIFFVLLYKKIEELKIELFDLLEKNKRFLHGISDRFGNTLLHFAARNNDEELAELLLDKYNFSVDITNNFGVTPLFEIVSNANIELFDLLLAFGADIRHKDINGQTVVVYAKYLDLAHDFYDRLISCGGIEENITGFDIFSYRSKKVLVESDASVFDRAENIVYSTTSYSTGYDTYDSSESDY